MKKEMLINVLQPEECRIAVLEDNVLEELYVERTSHESYVGNIYKGRIVNIEPSIQAAFVDFGVGRNGFLHVSDVEPTYYRHLETRRNEGGSRRGNGRDRYRSGTGPGERRPPRREPFEEAEEALETFPGDSRPVTDSMTEIEPLLDEAAETPADVTVSESNETNISFGMGLLDEPSEISLLGDSTENPAEESGRANSGDANAEEADLDDSTGAEVQTESDKDPEARPRGKRRTRGGSRRRRGDKKRRGNGPSGQDQGGAKKKGSGEEPPPRLMDSAERRTDEEDEENSGEGSAFSTEEEDLFFPKHGEEHEESAPQVSDMPSYSEPEEKDAGEAPREPFAEPTGESVHSLDTDIDEEEDAALEERAVARNRSASRRRFDEDLDEAPRRRTRSRDDRRGRPPEGRRSFGRPGAGRPKPLIQDIFKRGQEVLVQVIKEGIGTKGPTLSTYISIAGRYLVLMPGLNRVGVSRKIVDDEQRRRLREIFNELKPPKGLGFIIRTAGIDKNKKELQNDLAYLTRLWQVVVRRIRKLKAPAEIYQESDMITRTIRDIFASDIDTILVDEPQAFEHAREFLQIVMPRYSNRIRLYEDPEPLFYKYRIEEEIIRIQQRHVPLPNGGSIVIDQTEALVAIDVNSGNFRADNNAEETAYQMNLLAAKEIARQLRLRDLGGVIANDFIDMREEKHRRSVERAMREAVKRDRARTKILRISQFGIIEMTRQRIRPSLKRSVYRECSHCHGTGHVKTGESISIEVMRLLQLASNKNQIRQVHVKVTEEVANYLLNKKRSDIVRLEEAGKIQVSIVGLPHLPPESLEISCYDNNNNEVKLLNQPDEMRSRRR